MLAVKAATLRTSFSEFLKGSYLLFAELFLKKDYQRLSPVRETGAILLLMLGRSGELEQVGKRKNTRAVAVGPAGLEAVAADDFPAHELEAAGIVGNLGADDVAEDVGFAAAGSAGTGAAEELLREKGLGAVGPGDGEFGADFLDIDGIGRGAHGTRVDGTTKWPRDAKEKNASLGFLDLRMLCHTFRMPPVFTRPELLAPAGDWDCVRAAVANGADAVYFGLPGFNARLRAENFTEEDLPRVMEFLHAHGVKGYVPLNVLIFTDELDAAVAELRLLNDSGVDAVIIQDVGLAEISRRMFPALRVHASTQMTITSPEGVEFARELGAKQIVLARELSLRELAKFPTSVPLEVFVHGALCVAYSGQCLTSESLGQRSANRGECAQACRMPYQVVVDGIERDLGDKRYLLSPQDLAAVREIPELIRLGVLSFKIEGRLKSPEYVAAVTSVYRKAIDAALADIRQEVSEEDWYRMEMTFSRGLFSGWMHGVDHQQLVRADFGKKRGPFAGEIQRVGADYIELQTKLSLRAGDGLVFENAKDTNAEQGGRIYEIRDGRYYFKHGGVDFRRLAPGTRVWKTDDPALEAELRKSYQSRIEPTNRGKAGLHLKFSGSVGEPLQLDVISPHGEITVRSKIALQSSLKQPLGPVTLEDIFSRLNETPYALAELTAEMADGVFLPKSELNAMKAQMTEELDQRRMALRRPSGITLSEVVGDIHLGPAAMDVDAELTVLCRSEEQIQAALNCGVSTIYVDFEDIRRYKDAVRQADGTSIFLATPRIQKAGEEGFFKLIENAAPTGVLIRNIGAISYFANSPLRKVGDFSLNVSNPVTASVFLRKGLERVTISYDLSISQVLSLLEAGYADRYELTIHQHMPMFHMEHCVFAAFLSKGSTFLDCGRPCEKHRVHVKDRVGIKHPLRADVGCRNTLFNAAAQTGAAHFDDLHGAGLRHYRVELLEESGAESEKVIRAYQKLLDGQSQGADLWRSLKAQSQLGVTRGTLTDAHR
jgi:U32 family peptidase